MGTKPPLWKHYLAEWHRRWQWKDRRFAQEWAPYIAFGIMVMWALWFLGYV